MISAGTSRTFISFVNDVLIWLTFNIRRHFTHLHFIVNNVLIWLKFIIRRHFTHLHFIAPGTHAGKAHLLSDVIENIEHDPVYYQTRALSCVLGDEDVLGKMLREGAGQSSEKEELTA